MVASGEQFARGTTVALRGLRRSAPGEPVVPTFTTAAIVVEDDADLTVLCGPVGSTIMYPTGGLGGPRDRLALWSTWAGGFEERAWSGAPVVKVHRHGEPWSVWRWWEGERWSSDRYVNLESPWERTTIGFDTTDWTLDVVASDADGGWRVWFKDEDELAWLHETGRLTDDELAATDDAGRRAAALAESRGWPFDADWDRWRPDPSWSAVTLPTGWDHVDGTVS